MESIIGLKGPDFVLLACDTMLARSIYIMKDNSTKIRQISGNCMIGVVGDQGGTMRLVDFVASNSSLYEIKNGYELSPNAICHFTRNHIVANLRANPKSKVAVLLAGYDSETGPCLCFIDPMGSEQHLNYSGHGVGTPICSSIFHMMWKPELTFAEGLSIMRKCISGIQDHLVLNLRSFEIHVADECGVRRLAQIQPEPKKGRNS